MVDKVDDVKDANKVVKSIDEPSPKGLQNMTLDEIKSTIPDNSGWAVYEHNGFVHIKKNGVDRIKLDPPDKVTTYPHMHIYDENKNLIHKQAFSDGKEIQFTYKYDKKGNLTSCIHPDGEVEGMDYDENGNVSIYYKNKEEIERYAYDEKGRIVERKNALGEVTGIEYKEGEYKEGKETKESVTVTLPDGSKSKVSYDEKGNISRIEEESGNVLTYEYDALNRVSVSIDGNRNRTEFSYNDKDLLTGVKDAMGNTCRYEYTENGKLSLFEDFRGSITKLNYNEMNKIKDFTLPDVKTLRWNTTFVKILPRKSILMEER